MKHNEHQEAITFYHTILTLTAGTAASSTNKVTKKKPWALSPPGILTRSSKLLQKIIIIKYGYFNNCCIDHKL